MRKAAKSRIAYWDNVKFFLMLLVVEAHFFTNTTLEILAVYRIIYIFHMPLFLFVCGLFYSEDKFKRKNKVIGLFAIGILMNSINFLLNNYLFFESSKKFYVDNFHVFFPDNMSWFCFSLVICMIIASQVKDINKKIIIIISLITGVFCTYDTMLTPNAVLGKTASWFVFFYLGSIFSDRKCAIRNIAKLKSVKAMSISIFLAAVFFIYITKDKPFGILNYWAAFMGNVPKVGWLEKIIAYILTTFIGTFFLLSIPTRPIRFLTKCGQKTLQVYFWHMIIRIPFFYFGLDSLFDLTNAGGFIIYCTTILFIYLLLCTEVFKYPTYYLMKALTNMRR